MRWVPGASLLGRMNANLEELVLKGGLLQREAVCQVSSALCHIVVPSGLSLEVEYVGLADLGLSTPKTMSKINLFLYKITSIKGMSNN